MRVSINAIDNQIFVDGKSGTTDCSELVEQGISAVHWDDDDESQSEFGEMEFVKHLLPNRRFNDFSPFQGYIDRAEFPSHEPEAPPEPPVAPPAPPEDAIYTTDVMLDHENRIRKLEGQPQINRDEWVALLKQ